MSQDHYDKRNKVNTNDLENYIFEGDKRRKEKYIALFFVLIGIVGLYYITNSRQKTDVNNIKDPIYNTQQTSTIEDTSNNDENPVSHKKQDRPEKKNLKLAKHLEIDGFMEANEPVNFIIKRFNKNATYVLSLSNGEQIEFQQKEYQYTFKKPGRYSASLEVIYKDKRETIAQEKFEIMEAIAVAPVADKFDFQ